MPRKLSGKPPGRPKAFCEKAALAAAIEVFARKGFEGASLTDLTSAMGINRFSMYATYGNKEALYVKAMEAFNAVRRQRVIDTLSGPSVYDSLAQLLREIVARFTDPEHGVCFVTQGPLNATEASEATRNLLAQRRAEVEEAMRNRFQKGIADGELPKETSAADLACFYAVVIQGLALQAQHGGTCEELLRAVEIALVNLPRKSSPK